MIALPEEVIDRTMNKCHLMLPLIRFLGLIDTKLYQYQSIKNKAHLGCDGFSGAEAGAAAARVDETRVSLGDKYFANPCAACRVENMVVYISYIALE